MRSLAALSLLAVATAGLAGCSNSSKHTASDNSHNSLRVTVSPFPLDSGTPGVTVGGGTPGTITLPTGSASVQVTSAANLDGAGVTRPKPVSGNFVVVHVEFHGKAGTVPVNPALLKLRTTAGQVVASRDGHGIDAMVPVEPLAAGDVHAGEDRAGDVVFDTAPLGSGGKVLVTDAGGRAIAEVATPL
jgi:hypothetical protein